MIDIKSIDRQRTEVLSIIYEICGGSKRQSASIKEILDWVAIEGSVYVDIIDYWVDEGCINRESEGTDGEEYFLTHKGIVRAEESFRARLVPKIKNL